MSSQYTDKITIDGSGYRVPRGITIDMTPKIYEQMVSDTLDFIHSTARPPNVGQILLEEIMFNTANRKMRIVPRPEDLPNFSGKMQMFATNAEVDPVNGADAAPKGVRPFIGGEDDPKTAKDERFDKASYVGTGRGSDAIVYYSPSAAPAVASGTMGLAGEANDDVLLHELVHALRIMMGKTIAAPTDDIHYDNEEEWLAILVANIYMSEKGDWPLRAGHNGFQEMRVSSRDFLNDIRNLHLMMVLDGQMNSLFSSIASRAVAQPQPPPDPVTAALFAGMPNVFIPVREFNPIRLFRDNRKAYLKRDASGFGIINLIQGSGASTSPWSNPIPNPPPGMWGPGLQ